MIDFSSSLAIPTVNPAAGTVAVPGLANSLAVPAPGIALPRSTGMTSDFALALAALAGPKVASAPIVTPIDTPIGFVAPASPVIPQAQPIPAPIARQGPAAGGNRLPVTPGIPTDDPQPQFDVATKVDAEAGAETADEASRVALPDELEIDTTFTLPPERIAGPADLGGTIAPVPAPASDPVPATDADTPVAARVAHAASPNPRANPVAIDLPVGPAAGVPVADQPLPARAASRVASVPTAPSVPDAARTAKLPEAPVAADSAPPVAASPVTAQRRASRAAVEVPAPVVTSPVSSTSVIEDPQATRPTVIAAPSERATRDTDPAPAAAVAAIVPTVADATPIAAPGALRAVRPAPAMPAPASIAAAPELPAPPSAAPERADRAAPVPQAPVAQRPTVAPEFTGATPLPTDSIARAIVAALPAAPITVAPTPKLATASVRQQPTARTPTAAVAIDRTFDPSGPPVSTPIAAPVRDIAGAVPAPPTAAPTQPAQPPVATSAPVIPLPVTAPVAITPAATPVVAAVIAHTPAPAARGARATEPVPVARQPAAQAFAAAMFAADRPTLTRTDDPAAELAAAFPFAGLTGAAPVATLPVQPTPSVQTPVIDMTRDEWIGTMIEQIETIRDAAAFEAGDKGVRETRMKLAPDALGNVDVAIRRDADGQMNVRITADTPAARAMLAEAAPRLTELAEERGLKLGQGDASAHHGGGSFAERQPPRGDPVVPTRPAPAANDAGDEPVLTDIRIA